MSNKVITGAVLAGLALAGCTRIVDRQGYVADEELVTAVSVGVDNKASVEKTLGRPTFVSKWDPNTWYYLARTTEQLAFLRAKPIGQEMLKVSYDEAGNVKAVARDSTLTEIVQIDPEKDTTPVYGRDSGFFQDVFGNIGAVGTGTGGGGAPNGG
jgi:outer membrane protein assembly factor BamE (lipoprotein component of BamABCDE complex)